MKKTNSTTVQHRDDRSLTWHFWLWLVAALSAVLIIAVLGTAWAVRHVFVTGGNRLTPGQSHIVIVLAEFSGLVREAVKEFESYISGNPVPLLLDRKSTEEPHWVRRFPAPEDPGYLLLSGVDLEAKHSIVRLIRISDGATIARWDPDWKAIFEKVTNRTFAQVSSASTAQAVHPLLLADGDIIFNTFSSLVRLAPCNPRPIWVLDDVMHHSNELDISGTAIWVPSVSQDGFADNPWLRDRIRDDALARVSTEGRLLDKWSFVGILRNNGLQALLLGTSRLNKDPIHLNQIQVASLNSRYWKRGDLLISARNLSTVFLYRPSTGRIIWHQTGPWMNQHSADFVDDHRISVFDNNVIANAPKKHAFVVSSDTNRVLLFDFDTGEASQPFAALLAEARPISISSGRARVLPDGGLFVEETDYGRELRFTRDRMLWSYVNDYDDQYIGSLAWSRYLSADEARGPLQALVARQCSAAAFVRPLTKPPPALAVK